MLTGKQRAYLRGLANRITPIFQIGKGGITEETVKQLSAALEARELIKVRVLGTAEMTAKEAANAAGEATGADAVGVSGSVFILYRESVKNKRIFLSGEAKKD